MSDLEVFETLEQFVDQKRMSSDLQKAKERLTEKENIQKEEKAEARKFADERQELFSKHMPDMLTTDEREISSAERYDLDDTMIREIKEAVQKEMQDEMIKPHTYKAADIIPKDQFFSGIDLNDKRVPSSTLCHRISVS